MVFTQHDSWQWQMRMPKEDDSHERFWLYTARFIPPKRGEYRVHVIGALGSESLGDAQGLFQVAESYAEFANAELNVQLLQTLAKISGGEYYTAENAPCSRMVVMPAAR